MAALPQNVGLDSEIRYEDMPTNTFMIDRDSGQIKGMGDGLEAMRQAVDIILHTERFRWQIYNQNFGSELEGLIGDDYEFIAGELPRRIEDAFSVDSRILKAGNYVFSRRGDAVKVTFDVSTVYGVIPGEVSI